MLLSVSSLLKINLMMKIIDKTKKYAASPDLSITFIDMFEGNVFLMKVILQNTSKAENTKEMNPISKSTSLRSIDCCIYCKTDNFNG